jgi:predicted DNA-binding ribbon-helix-helix protein
MCNIYIENTHTGLDLMSMGKERKMKRLNINLPDPIYEDLLEIAKESGLTMTQVIRNALGLVDLSHREGKRGNKLTVSDSNDKVLKEIVMPG